MTGEQKQSIQEMRLQGLAYSQIAESIGLSVNTIKSFCRRNTLSNNDASEDTENEENKDICKHCGKRLKFTDKAKPKRFCDDKCRLAWWNEHRDLMNRQAVYRLTCACCGKVFDSYGNKSRKYCSHACYIKDRFNRISNGGEAVPL
jgi:rRNA maturation endonuclease Nob1